MRRFALCVLAALLAAGCRPGPPREPARSAPPMTQVSVRSGDLELKMSVSRPEIAPGSPLILTFLLRNVGSADRIIRSLSPTLFDFAVYAADGRAIVKPSVPTKPLLARPALRVLHPGQAAAASIAWTGTSAVVPGKYFLEGYAVWTGPGAPLLTTPRLAIQIRR